MYIYIYIYRSIYNISHVRVTYVHTPIESQPSRTATRLESFRCYANLAYASLRFRSFFLLVFSLSFFFSLSLYSHALTADPFLSSLYQPPFYFRFLHRGYTLDISFLHACLPTYPLLLPSCSVRFITVRFVCFFFFFIVSRLFPSSFSLLSRRAAEKNSRDGAIDSSALSSIPSLSCATLLEDEGEEKKKRRRVSLPISLSLSLSAKTHSLALSLSVSVRENAFRSVFL